MYQWDQCPECMHQYWLKRIALLLHIFFTFRINRDVVIILIPILHVNISDLKPFLELKTKQVL